MCYKLITFDFTGTLMRFRIPPHVQYEKIANLYGVEIKNNQAFRKNFKTAFKTVANEHPNFGCNTNLHWTQWWVKVVKNTFIGAGVEDSQHLDAIAWHLIKLYSTTEGWEVVPGVKKVLHLLKQKGKRLGVISNMDPRLNNILHEAGLIHNFEFILTSYEAKCFKPQAGIFKLALEKYSKESTKPSESCHIGDSYKEDYLGAVQAGWGAILVNESSNSLDINKWCANFEEFDDTLLTA
ncbi:hypothetical protein GHT06_005353 [Daphnia sinensis]|uniref:Uncharacterized protein n=1 Tax=Daphnia sinensis TaxID=1820382 RepID=A0AAD5KWZ2_9CRUS|nr:hypothetical protein GHT06_005353 [Daphnia sinensis]